MIPISVKHIAQILDAQMCGIAHPNCMVPAVSTDTRHIDAGSLFFALTGERFDGHDFVSQAVKQGAQACVVSRKLSDDIPQLVVKDVAKALGELAHWVRMHANVRVVALTGSSGKTSVKEMTAAILKECGQTLYTQGNLNNDIGVPLTLLRLTKDDEFAVIELGANHIGEIAYTTALTQPESVLINNIAAAHLEGFGSLDGVAKAKGEIFLGLPVSGGNVFLNCESYSLNWLEKLSRQQVSFFALHSEKADYYASDIVTSAMQTTFVLHTPESTFPVTIPVIGMHNVTNAVASAALAMSVGATPTAVKQGLMTLKPVKGRLFPIQLSAAQKIYDDTYNANVGSMLAAINVLANEPGYRVFVVGDMAELGDTAKACHQQVGAAAKAAGIDCVLSVGNMSEIISQQCQNGQHFSDKATLITHLKEIVLAHPQLTILVKGSRSMRMEQIIEELVK